MPALLWFGEKEWRDVSKDGKTPEMMNQFTNNRNVEDAKDPSKKKASYLYPIKVSLISLLPHAGSGKIG